LDADVGNMAFSILPSPVFVVVLCGKLSQKIIGATMSAPLHQCILFNQFK